MLYISIAPISPRHRRKSSFLELSCKVSLICQNTQCYLPLTDATHYRICIHVFSSSNIHVTCLPENKRIDPFQRWLSPLLESGICGELRILMSITEQASRRGYKENATEPEASSTRQSDWRVRLPTMTHTTGKDSTVLLPLTHQQPSPPLLSFGAINLLRSASESTTHLLEQMIYNLYPTITH